MRICSLIQFMIHEVMRRCFLEMIISSLHIHIALAHVQGSKHMFYLVSIVAAS